MKKIAMVLMTLVMVGTGVAVANSVGVPWYVDNGGTNIGLQPAAGQGIGIVYAKNNTDDDLLVAIRYFDRDGLDLGPNYPDNTFEIAANSTVAFRPVAHDPVETYEGGQEAATGAAVPNRPRLEGQSMGKNGSIALSYVGEASALSGQITQWWAPATGGVFGMSHLLPAGG